MNKIYPEILRLLLIKPGQCIDKNILKLDISQWRELLLISQKNRVSSILMHFIHCRKCTGHVPQIVQAEILSLYKEVLVRKQKYEYIKKKLSTFLIKNNVKFLILKDIDEKLLNKYAPGFIPLKYDLDILGTYEDLSLIRKFCIANGYFDQHYPYGWPDYEISQYKFIPKRRIMFYPIIEFRYNLISDIYKDGDAIYKKNIDILHNNIWQDVVKGENNLINYSVEYILLCLYLLFFYEDDGKGLHNLFRIWLYLKQAKREKRLNRFIKLIEQYKMQLIVILINAIVNRLFNNKKSNYNWGVLFLALRMIDLRYITSMYRPEIEISLMEVLKRKVDRYYINSIKSLLLSNTLFGKIIFFIKPINLPYFPLLFKKIIFGI